MSPSSPAVAEVIAKIELELGGEHPFALRQADVALLAEGCGEDPGLLKRWIKRRLAGEPVAHILRKFEFRGLPFEIDKRAYITDPELTHLADAVLSSSRLHLAAFGCPPLLADIGVGCGSLALAIKHALPSAQIVGLDLDPDALAIAALNAEKLSLPLRLVESDLFDDWPADLRPPDLVYGDPPWGDDTTLYGVDRPASHYRSMPPASAFPLGGRTGVHRQIIQAVANRGWSCEIWLNGGALPRDELAALAKGAVEYEILSPAAGVHLLRCRVRAARKSKTTAGD